MVGGCFPVERGVIEFRTHPPCPRFDLWQAERSPPRALSCRTPVGLWGIRTGAEVHGSFAAICRSGHRRRFGADRADSLLSRSGGAGGAVRDHHDLPRIGLALSGGGARGIAHVGVLKVLEELRVPVHCVTGTSMGAIVGGTFASGRTPAAMEKQVLETDWDAVFRDAPPREEISVRRKIDDYKTLIAPEFGVKDGGLALPKGVIAGVSIESFFRVLADARRSASPISTSCRSRSAPWPPTSRPATRWRSTAAASRRRCAPACRCRARSRRSRSTAGCWSTAASPTTCRSTEARKLCADVVIAVNISTPPLKRDEITSALSVVGQLVNFLGKQTVDEQLKSMGRARRAHRARPGRHLGLEVRPLGRRHPHRRGGDARAGRQARALQPAAGAVRGAARRAGGGAQDAGHGGRDPRRGAGAHRTRRCCSRS